MKETSEKSSLYVCSTYREVLTAAIARRKSRGPFSLRALAEGAGVQASYLTNVLRSRANLSQDQLYAMAEVLPLTEEEREFASLLLESERAVHPDRKRELSRRISEIQNRELKTTGHLAAQEISARTADEQAYYLDPMVSLVHVFLRVAEYASRPERIGEELKLSSPQLGEILAFLENQGFIRWDVARKAYRVDKHTRHLDPASPVCRPHQMMMRLKSLQRMSELGADDRYTLSITYFADRKVRRKVRAEFLQFLKRVDRLVAEPGVDDEVFQMNFDLFPWSAPPPPP